MTCCKKIAHYLKTRSWHCYTVFALIIIGGFLRFYRIPQTVMFLGDQGRDALIVARMFKEMRPVLIGPVTSVGNMYLGPLYYYFMLPFLWLSYPSPLGPVYAVAFFSTLTIPALYWVVKKMFSPITGLLAAFFLTFTSSAVELSRFSWNPNLAPFISVFMLYFSWRALKNSKNWIVVTALFSAIIQLHYLTLLTGASAGVLWLLAAFRAKKGHQEKVFIKHSSISLAVVLISFLPLVAFDLRHGGINFRAVQGMFTQEEIFADKTSTSILDRSFKLIKNSSSRANTILVRLNIGQQPTFEGAGSIAMLVALGSLLLRSRNNPKLKPQQDALLTLTVYLLVGIVGTAAYQHSLFTHYIAYLIPVASIMLALTLRVLIKELKWWATPLVLTIMIGFVALNSQQWPLQPNYLYLNTQEIANQVEAALRPDDRYEIVLLSETRDHYGQSYRYFLSTIENPPIIREKGEIPNTLVIIDEEKLEDDVTQVPIYDIQVFPNKEIDQVIINEELANIYFLRKKEQHE